LMAEVERLAPLCSCLASLPTARADAARFLPENVSISRVVGALYTSELQQLGESFEGVVLPEGDALNPVFAFRHEVAAPKWLDPTLMVLLQVEAIDRDELELRVVGYAMLNVFVESPARLQQPSVDMERGYFLNQGKRGRSPASPAAVARAHGYA